MKNTGGRFARRWCKDTLILQNKPKSKRKAAGGSGKGGRNNISLGSHCEAWQRCWHKRFRKPFSCELSRWEKEGGGESHTERKETKNFKTRHGENRWRKRKWRNRTKQEKINRVFFPHFPHFLASVVRGDKTIMATWAIFCVFDHRVSIKTDRGKKMKTRKNHWVPSRLHTPPPVQGKSEGGNWEEGGEEAEVVKRALRGAYWTGGIMLSVLVGVSAEDLALNRFQDQREGRKWELKSWKQREKHAAYW